MKHKQGLSELNLLFFHYMATHKHLCVSRSFPIVSGAAFSCCVFKGTETYCLYAAHSRRSRKLQSCSGWPWERLKSVSRWVSLLRSLEKWLFWPLPSWNVPGESHTVLAPSPSTSSSSARCCMSAPLRHLHHSAVRGEDPNPVIVPLFAL